MMSREAAHAAITHILSHRFTARWATAYSEVADDILDAIYYDPANVWAQGYLVGMNDEAEGRDPHESSNPYAEPPTEPL